MIIDHVRRDIGKDDERDPLTEQVGGSHYKAYRIQPAEFCQLNGLKWCEANIVKYACRWRQKGGVQDLDKIIHYVELLKRLEKIGN